MIIVVIQTFSEIRTMNYLIFSFIFFISFSGFGQNYNVFESEYGYFSNKDLLDKCYLNLEITKKKENKMINYEKSKSLNEVDLVFVSITGKKSHNPITPCRIIADSTSKYGYYFVTLEELSEKKNPKMCRNTWRPPLNNDNFKIYRKDCFDNVVNEFINNR